VVDSTFPIKRISKNRGAFDRDVIEGLSGSYTESPPLTTLEIDSNSTSFMSCRINFDALGSNQWSNTILAWGNGSDGWVLTCNSSSITLWTEGGDSGAQAATINIGQWHHFIGVFDQFNNTIKIYLDGNHVYTNNTYTDNSTDTSGVMRVGSTASGGNNGNGKFGDIVYGKGTISDAQARALSSGIPPEKVIGKGNILAYVPCTNGRLDEAYGRFLGSDWIHSNDNYSTYNTKLYKESTLSALPIDTQLLNIYTEVAGIIGTTDYTEDNDISTANGTVSGSDVSGTLSETELNDTIIAIGDILVIGTTDHTDEDDTSTTSGAILVSGTISETELDDTIIANGVLGDVINGTLDKSDEDDTSAISGTVQEQISGTLSETELNDTIIAIGDILVTGTTDTTEDNDISTTLGFILVTGTIAETELNDTSVASGTQGIAGTINVTENNDTSIASGIQEYIAILNITEDNDTLNASGIQGDAVSGNLNTTELNDNLDSIGYVPPEYTTLVYDITTILDKSTATNVTNYNNITTITDNTPDTLVAKESVTYLLSECKQGPAGPPTGLTTAIDNLPFIGSGTGTFKTSTEINGNIIYEEFGVLDELFVVWAIPTEIDRSKDVYFEGSFFPVTDGTNRTSSWEIHITSHNSATEYTGAVTATDLPIDDIAYTLAHGQAPIDHTVYLDNDTTTLHIRLKRIASTNDPTRIGVGDLSILYSTDGKVGEQGETGPTGPASGEEDVMYAKRVDFISDNLLYKGEAIPGTLDSTSVWRIRKITIAASDSDVVETWADGNDNFDNVWNDRLTYTYS